MFDLTTSKDFYRVLVEDFDSYMDEQHSAKRAFHCAVVAYHLYEWVWGDWLKADVVTQQKLGIRDKRSFEDWIVDRCIWFSFVRDIANGTKHFGFKPGFKTMRVAPFAFDMAEAGFDQGAWEGPRRYIQGSLPVGPQGRGYLLIDLGTGDDAQRWLYLTNILEVVVRFWRDFFKLYRPTSDLPVSRHHVD